MLEFNLTHVEEERDNWRKADMCKLALGQNVNLN